MKYSNMMSFIEIHLYIQRNDIITDIKHFAHAYCLNSYGHHS